MAIERARILPKLQLKYKGKSVTKNFLEKLADKYGAKLPDDADDTAIDDYINDRDDLIQEAISEADRRVTEQVNKGKKPEEQQQQEKPNDNPPADTPEWAKGLFTAVQGLTKTVTTMQAEKTEKTIAERFTSDERFKGIKPVLLKGRVPKTEEEYEAAVTEALSDLKEYITTDAPETHVPRFGGKSADKPKFAGKTVVNPPTTQKAIIDQVKKFTDALPKPKVTEVKTV